MKIDEKVMNNLIARGFKNETILNNRGLIGARIDETILEVVKNLSLYDGSEQTTSTIKCEFCGKEKREH